MELAAAASEYRSMVGSAYGRPRLAANQALRAICRRTARRRGLARGDSLYRQTHAAITVEIWRPAGRFPVWKIEQSALKALHKLVDRTLIHI